MKLLFAAAIATLQSTSTYAQPPRKVFVTSQTYQGNLGGVSGADAKCQALADAATPPVPGSFLAWLSDGVSAPVNSFVQSSVPYQLPDGTIIANNFADLIDGAIQNPINRDESGNTISSPFLVWTGTNTDGTASGTDCDNWSSDLSSDFGVSGLLGATSSGWTAQRSGGCNNSYRLYCFQQDIPTSAPSKAPSNTPTSSPSNAPTLSKSGKSSTTKASKDMSAKSVKSVKASKNEGLEFNEMVLFILAIFFVILQDSDGSMLGAMLEGIQAEDGIHGRRILEDKEDLKALIVSLLEEKIDFDEY